MNLTPASARWMIVAAGMLFATGGAAIKACDGFGPFEVAGLRSGIAALTILILLPQSRRLPGRGVVMTSVVYAATLSLFAIATKQTTAANAVFLQSTAPLYVMLLGPRILGERNARHDLVVLALLLVGVAAFAWAADPATAIAPNPTLGNVLGCASGLTWALTLMSLRKLGRQDGNIAAVAAVWGNVIAFAINAPMMSPEVVATAAVSDWLTILWLGGFQVGVAYVLITRAVQHVPAFEVTLILMCEPAFNPFFTWLVHGETPAALALAGGAVICVALLLKALLDARARQRN